MAERIPQSVSYLVVFRAFLASDGKTPATGKTIAITVSKNGAAFGNPNVGALNATEISSGFYKFTLDTTDTGTKGPLAWRGAEATINDAGDVLTVASAHNAGFDGVPDVAAGANGGLPTGDASGRVTVVTNQDKTGYSLSQTFPANFSSLAITAGGAVTAGTVSDKTGYALSSAGLDAVVVEAGLNARQALSIVASASAGVLAGAATTTITIAAAGVPATNRITATVDASGNRSAVTLSPPA